MLLNDYDSTKDASYQRTDFALRKKIETSFVSVRLRDFSSFFSHLRHLAGRPLLESGFISSHLYNMMCL